MRIHRFAPYITAVFLLLSVSCSSSLTGQPTGVFAKKLSFSILQDYPKGEDLKEVQADLDLASELGIDPWRGSFSWIDYEPEMDSYDFAWLHAFADLAASKKIALRPYLGYTPEWAARKGGTDSEFWNNPPDRTEEWYEFVSTIAAEMRRHSNVLSFEIYNEENAGMWWDGSARDYSEVLKYGSAAVREAQKTDQVLFGGMTYPDVKWIEQVCGTFHAGKDFDVLPLHAYPETWTAGNINVENYLDQGSPGYFQDTFLHEADEHCGKKPIWINEMGFSTTPGKKTERDQANWWARAVATFAADPRVEHIGVYQIKEPAKTTAVIGEQENYYLGLTYHDRKKKLAFYTVKMLMGLLNTGMITVADSQLASEVVEGEAAGLYHHLFIRPDGTQVVFVWHRTGSPLVRLKVAKSGRHATEYMLNGIGRSYNDFDGTTLRDIRLAPGDVRIFAIR